MVTIGMNYDVLEGKAEQFESVFKSVLDIMNGTEGHAKSSLYKDLFKPNAYLIVSEWSDEAAFRAFISSDQFAKIVDWGKEQILVGRPTHEVYGGSSAKRPEQCPVSATKSV